MYNKLYLYNINNFKRVKMKSIKYIVSIAITSILCFSGCGKNNVQTNINNDLIKQKSPVRLVLDKSYNNENTTKYIENWAGIKGKSKINSDYTSQTFKHLKKYCGYGKKEFIESRVVIHTDYIKEEVWLFKDDKSLRDDKISGITIYSKYNPKTNITNTNFFGTCHTPKSKHYIN